MSKIYQLLALFLYVLITSCSTEDISSQNDTNPDISTEINYNSIDLEIIQLINSHREDLGLSKLNLLDVASLEAKAHSKYMIDQGQPSHDFFFLRQQNLQATVNAIHVSENVAYGYTTAQTVFNAWLNSDLHKQNLEQSSLSDIGIYSDVDSSGKRYYTNIFLKR